MVTASSMYDQEVTPTRDNATTPQVESPVQDREQQQRTTKLAHREITSTVAQTTTTPATDAQDPRAIVVAERAAGRGDSPGAVAALRQLAGGIDPALACIALGRIESHIVLGSVQSPLHAHYWAAQLRDLPAGTRARQGYDRLLTEENTKKDFDRCIAEMLAMRDDSGAVEVSLDIIRKLRAAGLGADSRVVDEIVTLNKRFGIPLNLVEQMLGGRTAPTDDELLDRLEKESPVDFSAYLQVRGRLAPPVPRRRLTKPDAKRDAKPDARPDADTKADTDTKRDRPERSTASGGGSSGDSMGPYTLAAANFEGVADADLNLRMSELLLRAAGVEAPLASWLARYGGTRPPAKLYGMSPDLPDNYAQFRILDRGNVVMSGAAIRSYLDRHGYIDPTIDAAFWKTNIAPLLCNESVVAASQAELMADQYDKQIAELQKLIGDRSTSPYIAEVAALQRNAAAFRELARKLQNKETTYAEQRALMQGDVGAIGRMIDDTRDDLAQAKAQADTEQSTNLVADYAEWQRLHPGVPYRAPEPGPGTRAVTSLNAQLLSLEEQRRVTELVLATPGMVMPGAGEMEKRRPMTSIQAPQRNPSEQRADSTIRTIESVTTSDGFQPEGIAKTTNRALVALMHLQGRVDIFSAGVTRLIGDLAGLVLPESMTAPIYGTMTQLRESAAAFSNAQSTVTNEDNANRLRAERANWEIPILDRAFTVQKLIESPDQVLFTVIGAIPVAKLPGLLIQGGIVGLQTMEAFFASYGRGSTVSQAISAAGLTAIQGAAQTLMFQLKLPVAVAGNVALVFMFGKLQGLSNAEIEDQVAVMLVTVGLTVGVGAVASRPRMTGVRGNAEDLVQAMRKADGQKVTEEQVRRDPVRDAQIDQLAERYRTTLDELDVVTKRLDQARKANDREATIDLSQQLGVISQKARASRDAFRGAMAARTAGTLETAPTKSTPTVDDRGFQLDRQNERVESDNGWYLDNGGREVNGKGQRVDADGRIYRLDGKGEPVPGQYLDSDGRLVNTDWKYIDEGGKLLTDDQIRERYEPRDQLTTAKLGDGTVITLTGADLNRGSGGTSNIWEGSVGGAKVVVKTPMGKPDAGIANLELAAARQLQALGGPKVLGLATFTRNGVEYTGVVLEHIAGIDLARVLAGEAPPFPITEEHLRALEGFRDATSAQKIKLFDVNPGDFILTNDGRIVPVDLAFETRPTRTTNPALDQTITKLRTFLGKSATTTTTTPSAPPPEMVDLVAQGIAKRGEAWGNNIYEGSCAHVAMRNAISGTLAGRESYVLVVHGLSSIGQTLARFGLDPNGRIAAVLAKLGYPSVGGHAIAAVRGADGTWNYLSWGRVELDWKTYTKEIWGPTGELQATFQPDTYVKWMFDNPRLHHEPRGTSPSLETVSREVREAREAKEAKELEAAAAADRAQLGFIVNKP